MFSYETLAGAAVSRDNEWNNEEGGCPHFHLTSPSSPPVSPRAAAEGGGSGPSQDGVHLGLGFNEGG